jgi:hypothetical protein
MSGALDVTEPRHLLKKLSYEIGALIVDGYNSYAAINSLRDAFHLREWIWHGRLENTPALQIAIMGATGGEPDWNAYINQQFPDFPLIRELCNGSKHFEPGSSDQVSAIHRAGYGSPLIAYGTGNLGYNVGDLFVQVDAGRLISVLHLVMSAREFWEKLFKRFPQLG